MVVPDLQKSPLGARIRFLRRRRGLTIPDLERLTGISHGTISRLERGSSPLNPAIIGKLLAFFGRDLAEAFPGGQTPQDQIAPISDFGSWLKNFRLRRGIRQMDLAKALGIHKVSLHRYEKGISKPDRQVLQRLIRKYSLEKDAFLRRYLENGNP